MPVLHLGEALSHKLARHPVELTLWAVEVRDAWPVLVVSPDTAVDQVHAVRSHCPIVDAAHPFDALRAEIYHITVRGDSIRNALVSVVVLMLSRPLELTTQISYIGPIPIS